MVHEVPYIIIKLITQETACFLLNMSLRIWPWKFNTSRTVLCRDVMPLVASENCTHRVCGTWLDNALFIVLIYLFETGISSILLFQGASVQPFCTMLCPTAFINGAFNSQAVTCKCNKASVALKLHRNQLKSDKALSSEIPPLHSLIYNLPLSWWMLKNILQDCEVFFQMELTRIGSANDSLM